MFRGFAVLQGHRFDRLDPLRLEIHRAKFQVNLMRNGGNIVNNKRKCTIATAVCLHRGFSHFYYLIYFLWVDIGLWIVGG